MITHLACSKCSDSVPILRNYGYKKPLCRYCWERNNLLWIWLSWPIVTVLLTLIWGLFAWSLGLGFLYGVTFTGPALAAAFLGITLIRAWSWGTDNLF